MTKGADAFRSIGEVASLLGVAPHVLRYWETQFSLLKPMKRPDGRRYYRPDDVRLAAGLCVVLRDEGLTIRGAKKLLARDRGASVRERGSVRLHDVVAAPHRPLSPMNPASEPEAEEETGHGPRLRRRHGAPPAPVFGHPSHDGPPAGWLADMVALNARLRDLRPSDAASAPHRAALSRLRDALARIC